MEKTREEVLAYEIATTLNDLKSIDWHIACANRHSEKFLREKLTYVLSKKNVDNPAGYYTYLVKLYGQCTRD